MFSSKLYRATALVVGVGSCGWYAYMRGTADNIGKPLIAATVESRRGYRDISDITAQFQPWDDNWDKRKSFTQDKDAPKPTATRHYILIRHGQYNLKGTDDSEKYLTNLGKQQAEITGKRLQELGLSINKIYESTMTRAKETSGIIQKSLPDVEVAQTDLLREGAPICPCPSHPQWEPQEHEFFADSARIEAAFRKFFHRATPKQEKDSVEVYVCHANVIRYLACRALQFPPEGWLRIGLHHCSITWITVRPNGKVSLRCLGDAGHLPPDKLTFN